MSLIDRYVAAVKRYLPPSRQHDVGEELTGLLHDRVAAEADRLGRQLADVEIAELLRRHGHPYRLAAAYRPVTSLVGANSFALYARVLGRLMTLCTLVAVAFGLYDIYRSGGAFAMLAVAEFWHTIFDVFLFLFFACTMVFHFIGDALDRHEGAWRWDPMRLPPSIDQTWIRVPLLQALLALLLAMSLLGIAVGAAHTYVSSEIIVAAGAGVGPLLPVLQGLALLALALAVLDLLQRYFTRVKSYAWAFVSVAIAAVLAWILLTGRVLVLTAPYGGAVERTFLTLWPELWVKVLLAVAVTLLTSGAIRAWRRARTPLLPPY